MGKIIKPGDVYLFTEQSVSVRIGKKRVGDAGVVRIDSWLVGVLKSNYDNVFIWLNDCKLTRLIYDVQISKRG